MATGALFKLISIYYDILIPTLADNGIVSRQFKRLATSTDP